MMKAMTEAEAQLKLAKHIQEQARERGDLRVANAALEEIVQALQENISYPSVRSRLRLADARAGRNIHDASEGRN
jgi:hypothetical protein